jgi:guanyl-specific ribonuclease Sa
MKRVVLFLKSILNLTSGITGKCRWKITQTSGRYTLTISGSGEMADYNKSAGTPWYAYRHVLQTLILKEGVTQIGKHAFYGCSSLTDIRVEKGNSCYLSVDGVLFGNRGTELIRYPAGKTGHYAVPDNVTTIGDHAFDGCRFLTSVVIPGSVTHIGRSAFDGCRRLTSVAIPGSVTCIGRSAFDGCISLPDVRVEAGNAFYLSLDGVLFGNRGTEVLQYPAGKAGHYTIPDNVTTIGADAFHGCRSLTSVAIPGSVTDIGAWAFYGCSSLTSVDIPDSVTTIGDWAFAWCGNLTSVVIPDSVTSIGRSAFDGCRLLSSVTIPDSVTKIGGGAFYGCRTLSAVTIPGGVTCLENDVFEDCLLLTSVVLPDGVTTIGEKAFAGCLSLSAVTIPGSVTGIGRYAFADCRSLRNVTVRWTTPLSVDGYAFYNVPPAAVTLHVPCGSGTLYEAACVWKKFKATVDDGNAE